MSLTPKEVVRRFIEEVRSGRQPERAAHWMAPLVRAHQVQAEAPHRVSLSPAEYAGHVREMWAAHGPFEVEIEELLAEGDKVYVRWQQTGWHRLGDGKEVPLTEIASAVYRVEYGQIVAYHIQIDRMGKALQIRESMAA
ncbi:ester cyclase [Chitinimonas lacunae]|uniref:Ester cyclase n=1 Tax=Chitinimonas lacunae TaxID=1963018 RepID=A0ABV8MNG0_9NEIS